MINVKIICSKTISIILVSILVVWSPFWEHILQAWRLRDHPNMLFIFFEDLKKDLKGVVKKAADFLGVQREEAEIDEIVANLSFAKLKESEGTEMALKLGVFKENEGSFVRSGMKSKKNL